MFLSPRVYGVVSHVHAPRTSMAEEASLIVEGDCPDLIQTVLLLELVRGVAMDLYWVAQGYYVEVSYIGFAAVRVVYHRHGLDVLTPGRP